MDSLTSCHAFASSQRFLGDACRRDTSREEAQNSLVTAEAPAMHCNIPLLLLLLALVQPEVLRDHPPRDRVQEALAVLEESLLGELGVDGEDGAVGRATVLHATLVADPVGGLFGVEAGLEGEEVPAEL